MEVQQNWFWFYTLILVASIGGDEGPINVEFYRRSVMCFVSVRVF
jgi:hypothetical protein